MKNTKTLAFAAAVALAPSVSYAGGFDLSGQPIDIIFEEGNYIEGRVGIVIPDLEGDTPSLLSPSISGATGNTADNTPFFTLGAKTDFTDRISAALIYDTPFLRETTYNQGLFEGTSARVEAETLTAIGRFKFNENFSVYGGPRLQASRVDLQAQFAREPGPNPLNPAVPPGPIAAGNVPAFEIDVQEYDVGFVAGFAAEIPKYKIRAAVTYNSEVEHDFDSVETFSQFVPALGGVGSNSIPGEFQVTTPQSINVDLQAPITTSTLVRANIRWVNWEGVDFNPPAFAGTFGQPVVEYTDNTVTYRLTVAQKINDKLAAFVTGSYEEQGDEEISLFKTTDGGFSIGGGVVIEPTEGLKLTLGGEYRRLFGISGVQSPALAPATAAGLATSSDFGDADVFALSARFGYSF